MKLIIDITENEWEYLNKLVANNDILGHYERLLVNGNVLEPCEDCVSRKEVFEAIDDCNSDGLKGIFCSYNDGERFKEYIKKLLSVTPKK